MNFEEYTKSARILAWSTTLENDEEECYKRLLDAVVIRESGSTEEKKRKHAADAVANLINVLLRWKEDRVVTITKSNGQSMLVRCDWPATNILEKEYGGSLLHRHVRVSPRCSSDVIRTIVRDLQIDVDARDFHGNTALHVLSRSISKQTEGSMLIKTLVDELGADSLAKDAVGRIPSEILRRFSPLESRSDGDFATAAPELELEPVKLEHSVEETRVCECLEALDKKRKLMLSASASSKKASLTRVNVNSRQEMSPDSTWSGSPSSPVKVLDLQVDVSVEPRSLAFSPLQTSQIDEDMSSYNQASSLSSFSSPPSSSSLLLSSPFNPSHASSSTLLSSPMPSKLPPLTPSSNISFYFAVLRVDSKPLFQRLHLQEFRSVVDRIEPSIKVRPLFQGNKGSSVQNATLDSLKKSVEPESGLAVACAIGPFLKKDTCDAFVKRWREAALVMVRQRVCSAECDLATNGNEEKKTVAECPLRSGNPCEFSLCIWAKTNVPSLDMLQRVSDVYFKSSKGGRRNLVEIEMSSTDNLNGQTSAKRYLGLGSPIRSSCSGFISSIKEESVVIQKPLLSMQRKPTFASFTNSLRASLSEDVEISNTLVEEKSDLGHRVQQKSFSQCISIV